MPTITFAVCGLKEAKRPKKRTYIVEALIDIIYESKEGLQNIRFAVDEAEAKKRDRMFRIAKESYLIEQAKSEKYRGTVETDTEVKQLHKEWENTEGRKERQTSFRRLSRAKQQVALRLIEGELKAAAREIVSRIT